MSFLSGTYFGKEKDMKLFIQMGVGLSVATFLTGCDTRLAMPSGGAAISGSSNSSTLSPVSPAASASHILSVKKAYDSDGNVLTGTMAEQSLSSLSTAVPAGYYSTTDLTSIETGLSASNIKVGMQLFGITGTFTSDADAVAGDMLSGKTAYVNGVKVTGNIETKTLSNASTSVPAGYYATSTTLTTVDTDLAASNIKSGTDIFGITGTAVVLSGTATDPATASDVASGKEYWDSTGAKQTGTGGANLGAPLYSMAYRKDTSIVVPSSSTTRGVATVLEESVNATAFQDYHKLVPDPKFDTDGASSGTYQLATIAGGRPSQICGTSGTIAERISDCSSKNGVAAFYDGKNYGQSGEGDWKLVTRTENGYEVWRDERTKLIWSDRLATTYNWYRAAGYASTDSTTSNTGGYDARPGVGVQPNPPVSVCVDASLIPTLSGYQSFTTPSENDERKGNLNYPAVTWRLPTIWDWKLAEANGLRQVLPNLGMWFWSATGSGAINAPWMSFPSDGGIQYWANRNNSSQISVRCIGTGQ